MFGRKYNPQEIAEHLRTWIAHGQARDLIGGYFASVRPDELECTRIMFSLHVQNVETLKKWDERIPTNGLENFRRAARSSFPFRADVPLPH